MVTDMKMTLEEHTKAAIERMKQHLKSQKDSECLSPYGALNGDDRARLMHVDVALILRAVCDGDEVKEGTPEQQKVLSSLTGCPQGFSEEKGQPLYWLDAVRDFWATTGLDTDETELMWTLNYFDKARTRSPEPSTAAGSTRICTEP